MQMLRCDAGGGQETTLLFDIANFYTIIEM